MRKGRKGRVPRWLLSRRRCLCRGCQAAAAALAALQLAAQLRPSPPGLPPFQLASAPTHGASTSSSRAGARPRSAGGGGRSRSRSRSRSHRARARRGELRRRPAPQGELGGSRVAALRPRLLPAPRPLPSPALLPSPAPSLSPPPLPRDASMAATSATSATSVLDDQGSWAIGLGLNFG